MIRKAVTSVCLGLLTLLFQATVSPGCTDADTSAPAASGPEADALRRTFDGHPDATALAAGQALTSALSPAELAYLNDLDWNRVPAGGGLRDPVIRKALLVMALRFPQSPRQSALGGFSVGVAHADGPCDAARAGVDQGIAALKGVLRGAAIGAVCAASSVGLGTVPCVGAAMFYMYHEGIGGLAAAAVSAALDQPSNSSCTGEDAPADRDLRDEEETEHPDPAPEEHPPDPRTGCPSGQARLGCRHACVPLGTGCDECAAPCPEGQACFGGTCMEAPGCAGRCDLTDGMGHACPPRACPSGQTCGASGTCSADCAEPCPEGQACFEGVCREQPGCAGRCRPS